MKNIALFREVERFRYEPSLLAIRTSCTGGREPLQHVQNKQLTSPWCCCCMDQLVPERTWDRLFGQAQLQLLSCREVRSVDSNLP